MHSREDDRGSIVKKARSETTTQYKKLFSELPDDILFLIFEKLEWIDRFNASRVCTKWFQPLTKIPNEGEFPWLFRHKFYGDKSCCQVKLTDEYSKRSYVIDQSGHKLVGANICASKFGWILMRKRGQERNNILIELFVYCPFNCKLINLPTFKTRASRHCTYSSNPTLPDCIFFAVSACSERIKISTCKIGDKKWKHFEIKLSIPYVRFSFECASGLLYAVLLRDNPRPGVYTDPILNSHVGTFDPKSREWKLIRDEEGYMIGNKRKPPIWEWHVSPVVYNDKELYLVCQIGCVVWELFKYDMEDKKWVKQRRSLGNRVLFIACNGSSLLVDAVGKLSNVANKAFSGFLGSESYYYPFSFSSRKTEYQRKFYVDDRTSEDSKFYERAWIMPTIS